MRWFRWSLPLLAVAVSASMASAQSIIVYNPYLVGTSTSYTTRLGKHGALSLSLSSFGPTGYGFGYLSPLPRYSYSSSVTIITYPQPVIVLPRESLYGPDADSVRDLPSRRDRDLDVAPPEKPLPGRDAGDFRPLEPDNRNRAEKPIPLEPPQKPAPPPEVDLPPPRPPKPAANPVTENARLIGLGKAVFAEQEYGRAAERLLQASKVVPNDALSHFLHAQALLALGKYLEAVDAIYAGMALQPDWPTKRFQPLELYGQHVAAYPEHLRRLEDTLTKRANDPVLLFLYAYQLWFDGRKDEARMLFQRARPGAADPAVIDRFLQAKPPAPPVVAGEAARNWL